MRTAKETRQRAWQQLGTGDTYGAFLLGQLVMSCVGIGFAVLAGIACVIGALVFRIVVGSELAAECSAALSAFGTAVERVAHERLTAVSVFEAIDLEKCDTLLTGVNDLLGVMAKIPIEGWAVLFGTLLAFLTILCYLYGFMSWGTLSMSIASARGGLKTAHGLSGFGNAWRILNLIFWEQLYVALWSLCFIVPGIRALFSYRMAGYLLVDHPDWTVDRCLDESKRLMEGNRMRIFFLGLSFIGWSVSPYLIRRLNRVAGEIAGFLISPYPLTAFAFFYEELLDEDEANDPALGCPKQQPLAAREGPANPDDKSDEQERT